VTARSSGPGVSAAATAAPRRGWLRRGLVRLIGEERAVSVVEFALMANIFFLALMGIFDFAMVWYAKSALAGAMNQAGRNAALEVNNVSQTGMDNAVRASVQSVFQGATVTFTRRAFDSFDDVNKPEPLNDGNANGVRDAGECFTDTNGNGTWDTMRGSNGQGTGDEVVLYTGTMTFNRLFPGWAFMGQSQSATIRASTVLKNQPFNNNIETDTVICT
jgi:Flp pilus assembly protein TadG